jgi:type I restriction enzyme, R subunit
MNKIPNGFYNETKQTGLVVDYYGVDLATALAIYDDLDVENALFDIREELPKLRDRQQRVLDLFTQYQCQIDDAEPCVEALRDERFYVQFTSALKDFFEHLDTLLPRPEALPFVRTAKKLGFIKKVAADRYRRGQAEGLNIVSAREKVRALIDQYIIAQGIDPKISPIDVLSLDFKQHVQKHRSLRAQAAEMEFALRHHISVHEEEDPTFYRNLSDRLQEIITRIADERQERVDQLWNLIQEVQAGRPVNDTGLDPKSQLPFLGILSEHAQTNLPQLAEATVEIVQQIRQTITKPNFWTNSVAQEDLRQWIAGYLDDRDLIPFDQLEQISDQLLQLARKNQHNLIA